MNRRDQKEVGTGEAQNFGGPFLEFEQRGHRKEKNRTIACVVIIRSVRLDVFEHIAIIVEFLEKMGKMNALMSSKVIRLRLSLSFRKLLVLLRQ